MGSSPFPWKICSAAALLASNITFSASVYRISGLKSEHVMKVPLDPSHGHTVKGSGGGLLKKGQHLHDTRVLFEGRARHVCLL